MNSAAKALSATELKKLVVAEGEVPGYTVEPVPASRARPITTSSARCRPLARVLSGLPPLDAATKTDRDERAPAPAGALSLPVLSAAGR
ncbi:hypothetical protein BIV23_14645 [Streptomyces monashensis]|uniref:Uncharacterized protein n=1 Tax=Streptomyces monashensis TaxID=1678012 RepID=A0A1S2QFW5_9ACTN|nr:hypothetical protein BIV23_14645 [Streptomyces monashensis]